MDATHNLPTEQVLRPPAKAFGFQHLQTNKTVSCDAVIIGAGPGGGSVAKVLSEAGLSVWVIESGPAQSRFKKNYAHTARYHMQENGTIVASGSTMMPIAAGKGVGGSTLINSALSFRAPEKVLKRWETELNDPRWGPQSLNPLFDDISKLIGVQTTGAHIAGKNNELIVRGIQSLGLEGGLAPRSTPGCVGCGVCYYGCPSGGKASTNLTLLARACEAGTQIQAEAEVKDILIDGNKAVGIKAQAIDPETGALGGVLTVRAKKVYLCAGAIGSPKLLWLSGLASSLSPAVGKHLHVHPGSTLIGICDEPIEMWKGATQGAYFHHPDLPGVLPHTFSAPPEACLLAAGYTGSHFQEGLAILPKLCGMLVMVSDKGEGTVRAYSDGRAKVSYYFDDDDIRRIKSGLIEVAKVLFAGGAKRIRAPIYGFGEHSSISSIQENLHTKSITDFTLYAAHPMSTCRMGTSAENSVISSEGECHRINGLYIADASIFPSSLGVNPQLSTMVCATQVATLSLDKF